MQYKTTFIVCLDQQGFTFLVSSCAKHPQDTLHSKSAGVCDIAACKVMAFVSVWLQMSSMLFKNASACDSVACKVMVFCFPLVTDEFTCNLRMQVRVLVLPVK